jgi:hypothetical protein
MNTPTSGSRSAGKAVAGVVSAGFNFISGGPKLAPQEIQIDPEKQKTQTQEGEEPHSKQTRSEDDRERPELPLSQTPHTGDRGDSFLSTNLDLVAEVQQGIDKNKDEKNRSDGGGGQDVGEVGGGSGEVSARELSQTVDLAEVSLLRRKVEEFKVKRRLAQDEVERLKRDSKLSSEGGDSASLEAKERAELTRQKAYVVKLLAELKETRQLCEAQQTTNASLRERVVSLDGGMTALTEAADAQAQEQDLERSRLVEHTSLLQEQVRSSSAHVERMRAEANERLEREVGRLSSEFELERGQWRAHEEALRSQVAEAAAEARANAEEVQRLERSLVARQASVPSVRATDASAEAGQLPGESAGTPSAAQAVALLRSWIAASQRGTNSQYAVVGVLVVSLILVYMMTK